MDVSTVEAQKENTYPIYTRNIYICFPGPSNSSGLYELFMVKSSLLGREPRRDDTHMCQSFTVLHGRYFLLVYSFLLIAVCEVSTNLPILQMTNYRTTCIYLEASFFIFYGLFFPSEKTSFLETETKCFLHSRLQNQ